MSSVLFFIDNNTSSIILALAGLCLILTIVAIMQQSRISKLLEGKNGKTLEDTIVSLLKRTSMLEENKRKTDGKIENINSRVMRSIQGIETIRFNPFKGTGDGGNQSFSTAFLNEEGDGIVISSLYSRDRVSVFAKPVKNMNPEFGLSDEEKEALEKAEKAIQK